MRQPILYADQMWRRNRILTMILLVFGVSFPLYSLVHSGFRAIDPQMLVYLLYLPAGLALGAMFLLNRWRSYLEVTEEGIRVGTLFSSFVIDFDHFRQPRVQLLEEAFADSSRRRFVNSVTRPLLKRPALFIKLRGGDDEVAALTRRLGGRVAYDGTAAFPVPDPEAIAGAIADRLPDRGLTPNLGGSRRRKRRR